MGIQKKKRAKETMEAFLFLAPFIGLACVFMVYPIAHGFINSLFNTKWGGKISFVGLDNYLKILTEPAYQKAILNTLLFVVIAVPCIIILGLIIASSVFDKNRFYVSMVRVLLYIPNIVSMVVMSTIWRFMLNSQSGLMAYFNQKLGIGSFDLLASSKWAKVVIIFVLITVNIGQCVLLYIAQMIGIDHDLIDACSVDGGNRWDLFRYILVPLCKKTTILTFITNTSLVLKVYIVIQLLTAGGPNYATTTMMYQLYQDAFVNFNTGVASAMGVLLFILTIGLISVRFITDKKGGASE